MSQSLLKDEKIVLCVPETEDLERLFIWENDASMWNVGNAVAPYSHKQLWDYIESYEADIFKSRQLKFIIKTVDGGDAVGEIDVFDFDPVNRHASLGILIDGKYRNMGYATRAINVVCEYCSKHIGMHSLLAVTEVENLAGQSVFKKAGFSANGCLKSWVRRGNTYKDAVILQRLFEQG